MFFFFFFCIQHILQANDLVNMLASGLSLSCELTFCPYKAAQDGGSCRKLSVKGSFHIKVIFWGRQEQCGQWSLLPDLLSKARPSPTVLLPDGSRGMSRMTVSKSQAVPQFPSLLEVCPLPWHENPGGDKEVVCLWPSTGVVTPGSDPPP